MNVKIICIDDRWETVEKIKKATFPTLTEIVTVIDTIEDESGKWYMLAEYPKGLMYDQAAFAPISEIDETEIFSNRKRTAVPGVGRNPPTGPVHRAACN